MRLAQGVDKKIRVSPLGILPFWQVGLLCYWMTIVLAVLSQSFTSTLNQILGSPHLRTGGVCLV